MASQDNNTVVDRVYQDFQELDEFLLTSGELSFKSLVQSNFRKSLLLTAASYFETLIQEIVEEFVTQRSNGNISIIAMVKIKVISRQYHTYFNWEGKNANSFFKLFGEDFKNYMIDVVKNDDELKQSIIDFLKMGSERNRLVHQNFGTYQIEKTTKEIYELYESAVKFPRSIMRYVDEFEKTKNEDAEEE